MFDNLLKPFTVDKYNVGERHARSLDPNNFLRGNNYVGPHTDLLLREKIGDNKPINDLDQMAKDHDYSYLHGKKQFEKDHNKKQHINNVWKSDDIFINKAKNSQNDPIIGNIASKLISTKKHLEQTGLMDTKRFSGFGIKEISENNDPVSRLRSLVQEKYSIEEKKNKIKTQKGGLIPLLPIGIAIASALGSKLVGDLYDFVKKK